ncbi:MAG: hypothetical protein NTZ73_01670 [Candidatus Diapherotrites archaeon]|nr:hypothetical protein [Candidatus Diapherotrites archaeon]
MGLRRLIRLKKLQRLKRDPERRAQLEVARDFRRYSRINQEPNSLTGEKDPGMLQIASKQRATANRITADLKKKRKSL